MLDSQVQPGDRPAGEHQMQPGSGLSGLVECSRKAVRFGQVLCSVEKSALWELLHANSRGWQLLLYGATLTIQPIEVVLFGAAIGMQSRAIMCRARYLRCNAAICMARCLVI